MSSPSNVPVPDVRILRQGQFDAGLAQALGARRLAEITHLPTGSTSDHLETLTVPPGCTIAASPAAGDETLLHVVAGRASISWGNTLDRTTTAHRGDTVLIPAGTAFEARNGSTVETLQCILVRSD